MAVEESSFAPFGAQDNQLLIKIVKAAQGLKIKGRHGNWKQFLRATNRESTGDPAKHNWETLASFVQTFTEEQDLQIVERFRKWDKRCKKIDKFDSQGLWGQSPEQGLIQMTRQHERFKMLYSFPSYIEGWVMTKLASGHLSNEGHVRMISLDCEMVICENGERQLVRVSVVDKNCKTLLDMLVKPTEPVVDYLTSITGLSAADLVNVELTPADAQKKVKKLLTPGTILVGHSLYHDLRALKIDHAIVIDTNFIFQYLNKPPNYNAGLNDLCKAVLGHDFREDGKPHDCIQDAIIPMRLVLHKLKHGVHEPLEIVAAVPSEEQLSRLYIHSIPTSAVVDDLAAIFPEQYSCDIQDISWKNNKTGSASAVFKSKDEADKAFDSLNGQLGMDISGRPQKIVMIRTSSAGSVAIRIRKMSDDGRSGSQLEASKASITTHSNGFSSLNGIESSDDSMRKSKKTRTIASNAEEGCVGHLKEIESLRGEVEQRDREIYSLQCIIGSLIRNQAL